jgi:quinol-cytochrome oxidoreductase complex cytochrome b subunit
MSYRETNIFVTLVSYLLILGYYLVNWLRMYQQEGLNSAKVFQLWAVVIVAGIVLGILGAILTNIVLSIAHAIKTQSKEEARLIEDERDKLIELKGVKATYYSFSIGVFLAMLSFVFGQPALVMFSLIIFFSLIAEIIGDIAQLYLYRQGV